MDPMPLNAAVFQFDKSLLTRLEEISNVLQSFGRPVPASAVRTEWAYWIEIQMEPAGWQAFWRMPRIICESFRIPYPTVVFGTVQSVGFLQLNAQFEVTGVQDAAIRLPRLHEVALIDLLPVREQENSAINIETTANCLDMLRYFYQHVWRPWDGDADEDVDWAEQHLRRRVRFHHDLMVTRPERRVSAPLAAHCRALLAEAQDLQRRREYLELDISDDEDVEEGAQHKSEITDLMRLHLRLTNIRSEMDILENPAMRQIYEDVRRRDAASTAPACPDAAAAAVAIGAFIVSPVGTLAQQRAHLDWCESFVGAAAQTRFLPGLQQCLDACLPQVAIYLPGGQHAIKFAGPLPAGLRIVGRQPTEATLPNGAGELAEANSTATCIRSREDDSKLLSIDDPAHGAVQLEGLRFDCGRVRTGIHLRRGRLVLRNCHFRGDASTNTKCAITVTLGAAIPPSLELIDCSVRDFAVAINLVIGGGVGGEYDLVADGDAGQRRRTEVTLRDTEIAGCSTAIECAASELCRLRLERGTRIGPNSRYGVSMMRTDAVQGAEAKEVFRTVSEIGPAGDDDEGAAISGADAEFVGNELGNIVRFNYNYGNLFVDEAEVKSEEVELGEEEKKEVVEEKNTVATNDDGEFAMPQVPRQKRLHSDSEGEPVVVVSDSDTDMSTSIISVDD